MRLLPHVSGGPGLPVRRLPRCVWSRARRIADARRAASGVRGVARLSRARRFTVEATDGPPGRARRLQLLSWSPVRSRAPPGPVHLSTGSDARVHRSRSPRSNNGFDLLIGDPIWSRWVSTVGSTSRASGRSTTHNYVVTNPRDSALHRLPDGAGRLGRVRGLARTSRASPLYPHSSVAINSDERPRRRPADAGARERSGRFLPDQLNPKASANGHHHA